VATGRSFDIHVLRLLRNGGLIAEAFEKIAAALSPWEEVERLVSFCSPSEDLEEPTLFYINTATHTVLHSTHHCFCAYGRVVLTYLRSIAQRSALHSSATMPPRKRRRSVAFAPTDDDDTNTRRVDGPSDGAPSAVEKANSGVWDSFREEYHEGIFYFADRPVADETSSRTTTPYLATRVYPHP